MCRHIMPTNAHRNLRNDDHLANFAWKPTQKCSVSFMFCFSKKKKNTTETDLFSVRNRKPEVYMLMHISYLVYHILYVNIYYTYWSCDIPIRGARYSGIYREPILYLKNMLQNKRNCLPCYSDRCLFVW